MSIYIKHKEEDLLFGIWEINETEENLVVSLPHGKVYLNEAKKRFQSDSRRKEWLAVRTLLYLLLNEEKEIGYHENGAPYLVDGSFQIAISHTKGFASVILHPDETVGIDIELRTSRILKVRSRFISAEEEEAINKDYELDCLLLHWCAKETVFKMMNCNDVDLLNNLHVQEFDFPDKDSFLLQETKTNHKKSYRIYYDIYPDFVLTWSHAR